VEPRWSPDGSALAWVAAADGVAALYVEGRPAPVGSVSGTRGGVWAWVDAERLIVVDGDGALRVVARDGVPGAAVAGVRGRPAAPAVSPDGTRVAFVDDTDDACVIAVAPLDGSGPARVVSGGADYSWDPAWSPDGRVLAWHEWDFPAMPWDASRIVVADADGGNARVVAGGDGECVGQPRFAPVGAPRLAFVSDRDGWLNVSVADPDGGRRAVVAAEALEHAEPTWSPGQRSFAWSPDGLRLAWCRNEDGFGRLVVAPVDARHAVSELSKGWHRGLDWGPLGIAAVRSGARTPPTVVVVDVDKSRRALAGVDTGGIDPDALVEPTPVTWRAAGGTDVHGLLYRSGARASAPFLAMLHGGPTDQVRVDWDTRVAEFVGRGWTVFAPNPRGSTGYGRAYAQALTHAWGVVDVDDAIAGIGAAIERGWADPARIALHGSSAGGFTALLVAAAAPELVRAVAATYPVTNLVTLTEHTHRYESRYNDMLVGPLPAAADEYRRRSPIARVATITAPVLLLQGTADPVVPTTDTIAFADALGAAGGDVTLQLYEGEGHGWWHPDARADAIARTFAFLDSHTTARGRA
jgi:dipeptidyl aminopeptidase/acylaminoacyl peptidase